MDTSKVATKVDIKAVKTDVLKLILELKEDIKGLQTDMDAKLDKLQNTLDGFVGTVDDLRTDNTVGTHHTRELQIKVDDHDLPAGRQERD